MLMGQSGQKMMFWPTLYIWADKRRKGQLMGPQKEIRGSYGARAVRARTLAQRIGAIRSRGAEGDEFATGGDALKTLECWQSHRRTAEGVFSRYLPPSPPRIAAVYSYHSPLSVLNSFPLLLQSVVFRS